MSCANLLAAVSPYHGDKPCFPHNASFFLPNNIDSIRMIRVPLLRPQLAEMNASLYIWNVGSVWSTLDHILRSPWNSWTLQTYKPRGPLCVGDSIAMPSKIIVHDARIIVMPELRDCPHGLTHSVVTPPSNRAIPFRSYAARTFQARMRFEQGRL